MGQVQLAEGAHLPAQPQVGIGQETVQLVTLVGYGRVAEFVVAVALIAGAQLGAQGQRGGIAQPDPLAGFAPGARALGRVVQVAVVLGITPGIDGRQRGPGGLRGADCQRGQREDCESVEVQVAWAAADACKRRQR
jgi:hypothetical protein